MRSALFTNLLCAIFLVHSSTTIAKNTEGKESSSSARHRAQQENKSQPGSPQQLIVGKWKHLELVRIVDDNRLLPQKMEGKHIAEFKSDLTWQSVGPNYRSAGTYRWINDKQIEQTIHESNLAIQVGMVSVKSVKVNRNHLELSIKQTAADLNKFLPPPKPGVVRANVTLVITKFERVTP